MIDGSHKSVLTFVYCVFLSENSNQFFQCCQFPQTEYVLLNTGASHYSSYLDL